MMMMMMMLLLLLLLLLRMFRLFASGLCKEGEEFVNAVVGC